MFDFLKRAARRPDAPHAGPGVAMLNLLDAEVMGGGVAAAESPPLELSWREVCLDGPPIVALARPRAGQRWALARRPRLLRTTTYLLAGEGDGWREADEIGGDLADVGILANGTVVAVGETRTAIHDAADGRTRIVPSGVPRCRRIWGAAPDCANALGDGALYCFDGKRWSHVALEDHDTPPLWADGDADRTGRGWIVGLHATHSCMAKGAGREWTRDGCSSWYLYHVAVGDDGHAFAAGGDGLWRLVGEDWAQIDRPPLGDLSRHPVAVAAVEDHPVAVAVRMDDLLGRGAPDRAGNTLEVYTGTAWRAARVPVRQEGTAPLSGIIEVDGGGRVLLTDGDTLWLSSPVRE